MKSCNRTCTRKYLEAIYVQHPKVAMGKGLFEFETIKKLNARHNI